MAAAAAAGEPPAKKAKKEATYLMDINDAIDKQWRNKTFTEIAEAPISALLGLADWTDVEFAKFGLSSIYEFGTWKFFRWARALCKLAATEKGNRIEGSRMNLNRALNKAHEGKQLKDILQLPPSALQGLAGWVDEPLGKLKITTIEQFGTWKYAEWASAIAELYDLEDELPAAPMPSKKVAAPTAALSSEAAALAAPETASPKKMRRLKRPAPTAPRPEADPKAKEFACKHGSEVEVISHYKLVNVDVSTNMDKFFILQTVKASTDSESYLFVRRWGRTGTRGQAKVEGPLGLDEVEHLITEKFKDKTGNEIDSVKDGSFKHVAGKYDVVSDAGVTRSTSRKDGGCIWQYWVDDGIDGKKNGWYDYTKDAAEVVEGVYADWQDNLDRGLGVRSVQSGHFCYQIDFNSMMQTNISHPRRKQRSIRRNV
jgi:predicted DNA-binding WGR domain protein